MAIIGLLISILLPSLHAAREQSRTVKCIANLKGIGSTMLMYLTEHDDWFPFEKRNWPSGTTGSGFVVSAFYYGGHPGSPSVGDQTSYTFDYDYLRDTFRGRPFNPYLYQGLSDIKEKKEDADKPGFWEERKQFGLFACPSDTGGFFNSETQSDGKQYLSIHHLNGSSYDLNYHFIWAWAARSAVPGYAAYTGDTKRLRYHERGNKFLARQRNNGNGSRFIILMEDPFDSSLMNRFLRVGWHKQWGKHSFLFLDGHAGNNYADVVTDTKGAGWKTASGAWYNDPEDPDYQYRDLTPF